MVYYDNAFKMSIDKKKVLSKCLLIKKCSNHFLSYIKVNFKQNLFYFLIFHFERSFIWFMYYIFE